MQFDCELIRPAKEGKVPVITWNQFKGRHGSPDEEDAVLNHGYAIIEFEKEQLAADSADAIHGPLATTYPGYTWGAIAMWAWAQSRVVDYLATTDYADMNRIVATGHSRGGKVALCATIYDERFAAGWAKVLEPARLQAVLKMCSRSGGVTILASLVNGSRPIPAAMRPK